MWGVLILLLCTVGLSSADNETVVVDFCQTYSSCKSNARTEVLKCAGGFTEMMLYKQGANFSNALNISESIEACNSELTIDINQFKHEYGRIEEHALKCAKSAGTQLEHEKELVCQAVYKERFESAQVQGNDSSTECYEIYEANLERCELIRECCPQFHGCIGKVESESGILAKENMIRSQLRKCFEKSGVQISFNNENAKEDKAAIDLRYAATIRRNLRKHNPFAPRGTPVPRISNGTMTEHGMFIIKGYKPKHNKVEKKEEQNKHEEANITTIQETQPKLLEVAKESPIINHDEPKLSHKQILIELLCRQFAECTEIIKAEERECDQTFDDHVRSENTGIRDIEMRALFLNNSKTDDPQIRRRCLSNVDAMTQKHLAYLKNEINRQNEKCAFGNYSDSVDLNGCQNLGVLPELSALKRTNKDSQNTTSEKCKERLNGLRQKCQSLQACCPQRVSCESNNKSAEVARYEEMKSQLQMEQNLCEVRLHRVHNFALH